MTRHAAARRGFTLIEVLVALALAGVVLLALAGGLALTTRGTERLAAASARIDERRQLAFWLRREIEAALPPDLGGFARQPFAGTSAAMRFLAIAGDGGGGLAQISIALETADGGEPGARLVLLRQPAGGGLPARIVLARGLMGADFAYWGRVAGEDVARWHAQWSDLRALPALVRVALRAGDDTPGQPVLVRLKAADGEAPRS